MEVSFLDITDDDQLLTDYINSAKAYLNNACNNDMSSDDRYCSYPSIWYINF
uniref:head-tail connector protein n=1 Tax=Lentilactobacillus hilgardii TaxID=1588 RepID=UPI00403F32FA